MVNGCGVHVILWDLYTVIFPVSAYDSTTSSFCCAVIIHNGKLYPVYDCMWHCWIGRNIGQLAIQHIYTGWLDDNPGGVGDGIYAQTMCHTQVILDWAFS